MKYKLNLLDTQSTKIIYYIQEKKTFENIYMIHNSNKIYKVPRIKSVIRSEKRCGKNIFY